MELMGIKRRHRAGIFEQLSIMEDAALPVLNGADPETEDESDV